MQILVVSDSHKNKNALREILFARPNADTVIHLGDGAREAEELKEEFGERRWFLLHGNCDLGAVDLPLALLETFRGKRFFCTHGHYYGVKDGLYRLTCAAAERGADVVLFGHTHEPLSDYYEGMYILNPGSAADGRYATLDVTDAGIMPSLWRL